MWPGIGCAMCRIFPIKSLLERTCAFSCTVTSGDKKLVYGMGSLLSGLRREKKKPQEAAAEEESRVVTISNIDAWKAKLENHKESGRLMVIDFKAAWCGPCHFMEPLVKNMAARLTSVDFVQIDVDEFPDAANQWHVEAMPTFVLVRGGNEVSRVVGASEENLRAAIKRSTADPTTAPASAAAAAT